MDKETVESFELINEAVGSHSKSLTLLQMQITLLRSQIEKLENAEKKKMGWWRRSGARKIVEAGA